jgi:8-oxo-dGTP pyrophosphatase MutT (NUDIX family)
VGRVPRDVSIQLFRHEAPRFLMLRRIPARGGFWQPVGGAPLPGEADLEAAVRETREETGFDVAATVFALGVEYDYALRPEARERWDELYGPGIRSIHVVTFAAEVPALEPRLDPVEHDDFRWCSYEQADALLDWPIEADALPGRRRALRALAERLA